jgi:hypothetical protein
MTKDSRKGISMSANRILVALAICISGTLCGAVLAKSPNDLDAARRVFSAAVSARDLKRIVALSTFPVAVEMYGHRPNIKAAQFLRDKQNFTDLFGAPDAGTVKCIASGAAALQNDAKQFGFGSWFVDCNGNEYFFAQRSGQWLFTAYQNINE